MFADAFFRVGRGGERRKDGRTKERKNGEEEKESRPKTTLSEKWPASLYGFVVTDLWPNARRFLIYPLYTVKFAPSFQQKLDLCLHGGENLLS